MVISRIADGKIAEEWEIYDGAGMARRPERLRADRADRRSVRINDQHRMTFPWGQGHAYEVRIEDYH